MTHGAQFSSVFRKQNLVLRLRNISQNQLFVYLSGTVHGAIPCHPSRPTGFRKMGGHRMVKVAATQQTCTWDIRHNVAQAEAHVRAAAKGEPPCVLKIKWRYTHLTTALPRTTATHTANCLMCHLQTVRTSFCYRNCSKVSPIIRFREIRGLCMPRSKRTACSGRGTRGEGSFPVPAQPLISVRSRRLSTFSSPTLSRATR